MPKTLTAFRISASFAFLVSAASLRAQVVPVPPTPQIGSSNPVTAEPPVPRPYTKPCTVTLFENAAFENFTPLQYNYAPPANCPGPWRKVVFTADFTVSEGRQYDRTASFYVGHANIYYGTTAEPRAALSPSWHVERDVTDLSAIFKNAQPGQADLGNFVGVYDGVTYNGIVYVTAKLEFYPTCAIEPAPVTPDIVVPVNGSGGDAGTLNSFTDRITQTLNLPRNVEQVYLDVISQSQSNDEFWYTCVPNNETGPLQSCGNTGFRESEIFIDGKPAGVAPVSPWIFTGGIDPYLWEPITGVQTLDFKPYRVNLTPFAGVLSDGNTHTISVGVYNADSYFLATANLLVYLDPWSPHTQGAVTENSLLPTPLPGIEENITGSGSNYSGTVLVSSDRLYKVGGYINTSHGRIDTLVSGEVHFRNTQQFTISATEYIQNITQTSTADTTTTTHEGAASTEVHDTYSFPLTLDYSYVVNPDNTSAQTTKVWQTSTVTSDLSQAEESVQSQDTLSFDASGNLTGASGSGSGAYKGKNAPGVCYNATLTAVDRKLTSYQQDNKCK